MDLEDRVSRLENEVSIVKENIKDILIELKELMLRNHNPLGAPGPSDQRTAHDRPVIIVS
ncbi:MAG: hypothetical protein CMJ45_06645 [Planctomyces sp.]|nr:hypothetical protein [Planctomyces sp.]